MNQTERQFFRVLEGVGAGLYRWTGPWPPPLRLLAIRGGLTGRVAISEMSEGLVIPLTQLRAEGATVQTLLRSKCSQLDEAAAASPHLARAAEYVVERTWT